MSDAAPKIPAKQTIHDILEEFRAEAQSNRDLGDRFERLICRYLELDPLYADRFSKVWMWNEWPQKGKVGDVGIDLVAQERATGEFCAIQCKFYDPAHTLAKEDIDSFFTASGKSLFTSCMIVSTTDKWGKNAEDALANLSKPVTRLRVQDLDASPVDWSLFSLTSPQTLNLRARKTLRPHQQTALDKVSSGFAEADRGKLIMACGTGKTFTALKIAEHLAPTGHVLFLVPSLSLLSQSLREWTAETALPLHSLAVCSDSNIGKKVTNDDTAEITTYDLAFPATTSARQIVRQYDGITAAAKAKGKPGMTVVFSTYQSIQAVSDAQKKGLPEFDLIICDEAHRTTGVTLSGDDESHFVKIHDAAYIKGKRRLYMTATPRIYSDDTKTRAKESDAELCSMDDPAVFGEEFHRLGFGEAVGAGLLSDYQVLVLAVDEKYVSTAFQRQIADANNELNLDDAVKITGCWNGLAKRLGKTTAQGTDFQGDTAPMRRAVAFSRSIKDSKAFTEQFAQIIAAYRELHPDEDPLQCELDHVDGTYHALRRNALLDWLKADTPPNTCRVLSNARCLSEGVDVPALDAVLFLNPRNSIVDVVQSVGRVMRKAEGKKYGYIILPIGIPADMPPEEALRDNQKYKVVWQVLQALRAHDDRFNATVNQIELNEKRPDNIQVIGVGGAGDGEQEHDGDGKPPAHKQGTFFFPQLEEWKDAIYARIVLKCGDRRYWESWAKDVAVIAERHTTRIKAILENGEPRHKEAFAEFLAGLHANINPSITEDDAIEMLSQHLITRPVFDALFENYVFTQHNPVSVAMQKMLDTIEDQALEKETEKLDKFYASVKERASGIDNALGKQRVVVELYDKFFRTAFPRMAERLGIAYTPVEIVDFIIHSINAALAQEFNSDLGEKDVHIIDPFTGTGTFIVRLLQSGLIQPADLLRKYKDELHANEIVLLAYYIAAINIEEAFHALRGELAGGKDKVDGYLPFQGIVLTDTFQISESMGDMEEKMFPENNRRVRRQKSSPIRVVIGNPPYSAGQGDANANNQNLKYPKLDERIRTTYAERSAATNKNSLYDSYIRAIRWASDRINGKGIVGFVSNGYFIDANAMDGLRASLTEEFTTVYIFNLRGNARTSGEQRRMEKGNVFGESTRTPVAISILIKNPEKKGKCELYYHDIGDYLDREEKLEIITRFQSIEGIQKKQGWHRIIPNASHDWINQRDEAFGTFVSIGDKRDDMAITVFESYSSGLKTCRDAWCYNFSRNAVETDMQRMIGFFNQQVEEFATIGNGKLKAELPDLAENFIDTNPQAISWSRGLINDLIRLTRRNYRSEAIRQGIYRPFCKQWVYFDRHLNDMVYQLFRLFPSAGLENLAICMTSPGNRGDFSVIITDALPDLHMADKSGASQCFPLYLYEKDQPKNEELISEQQEGELIDGYRRRDAITDTILADFRAAYGNKITKEDIFYYVYGVLHSPEYRRRFAADLKKMLPRIPFTKEVGDFRKFSKAGRELAHWHLNYETVDPYPLNEVASELTLTPEQYYRVQKMTFARKDKAIDKTAITYNANLTLTGIPLEAYDYVVNGKPALEWLMERYQITVDKDSGIRNDPNDWMTEHGDPAYLLNLIKRIVRVSVETIKIVNALPPLNEVV
ncbi:MAG: damage-inducible protein [Verrucomicrobia bacterium 61-8]|nr:DEAD/DEAH box helicase [Verrucomicrobiota bacterium]OJV04232.1 MAG: damage-inducible protein [Verrucomicrobia bacterium 61-8]